MRDLLDRPSERLEREMMLPSIVEQALAAKKIFETFGGRNPVEEALAARRMWEAMGGRKVIEQAIQNRRTLLDFQNGGYDLVATARSIARWGSLVDRATLSSLTGTAGETARVHAWASSIAKFGVSEPELTTGREFARIYAEATKLLHTPAIAQTPLPTPSSGTVALHAELALTRSKLSMLAATRDVLGSNTIATAEAQIALLGEWRTRSDLPQRFWRDPALRNRYYEEANVDPGLADSDAGAALSVMITSGFAAGTETDGVSTAVIGFGGVSVTVQARGARSSAYLALTAFEERLRAFITAKLEEVAGPAWFKQRVDGAIVKKAKDGKEAARKNGESDAPLIEFTDLGDLVQIMLRKDNWDDAFGALFVSRERFVSDTQSVIATRRPTMHSRSVDGTRLLELLIILQRLAEQMAQDKAWRA